MALHGASALELLSVSLFVVTVVALCVGCAAMAFAKHDSRLLADRVLLASFSMMLFVAWVFEPYIVHLCGWEGLETTECQRTVTGQLWLFYAKTFDPVFLNLPFWLRIVCSLDTLLFGPFYAVSVFAFAMGRPDERWYARLALPMSGALLYSTIVYFAYEILVESHRASLFWVFMINLPWTLMPFLLILRLAPPSPTPDPGRRARSSRRRTPSAKSRSPQRAPRTGVSRRS
jgi:hypothetical protein